MIEIIDTTWMLWLILLLCFALVVISIFVVSTGKIRNGTKIMIIGSSLSVLLGFLIAFTSFQSDSLADYYSSALHDNYGLIVSESDASLAKDVSLVKEGSSDEIVCTIEGDESDRKYGVYLLSNGDGTCSAYTKSEKGAYLPVTKVATKIEQVE